MNFTSEEEVDDSLPFLDVFVMRDSGKFITSVYRKPTFSGVYTNYNSYIPLSYKTSLVSTLLYRAYTICSNWKQIHAEFSTIKSVMAKNCFPSLLLDQAIARFMNTVKSSATKNEQQPDDRKLTIVLPYLGSYTNQVERKIKHSLKQHLPSIQINFIFRASTRLQTLFSFKDKIPSYLQAGIIYKFTCGKCKSTYIGETTRHTKTRFFEHMGKSALTGKKMKRIVPSAVNDHTSKCQSVAKYADFQILGKDNKSELSLQTKETLFIHRDKPDLNDRKGSVPLDLFDN